MSKKLFSSFLLIIVSANLLIAQNHYTLRGIFVDNVSKDKLSFVQLGIATADSTAHIIAASVSDINGAFIVSNVPEGHYILKTNIVGYEMLQLPIDCEGFQTEIDLGIIEITHIRTNLQAVSITAEKPLYLQDGEKTLYNVQDDPAIQSGTAADALQNAPGVEVDIEGNITLRGVSSVEIWINGRPSHLTEDNLKEYIQQLPANALESIEVITNPSARYSSNSDGGIINLVTTSNIKKNSFLSFGLRGSSTPNVTPWISYVWANEKLSLSFYLNGTYSQRRNTTDGYGTQFADNGDTSSYNLNSSKSKSHNFSGNFNFNGTYTIDSANTLSFWAGVYPRFNSQNSSAFDYRREYLYNSGLYLYDTDNQSRGLNYGGHGGLNFRHDFAKPGHRIETDVNFRASANNSHSNFVRDYYIQDWMDKVRLDTNRSTTYGVDASIDYTIPYHKNGEISMGMSGNYGHDYGLSRYDTLQAGTEDIYNIDSLRLKETLMTEGTYSTYITLEHKFGNFTIKGGLRYQFLHYDYQILNSPDDNVTKNYPHSFYPSLHLSYRTKSMHNFKLSYTRRVSNPGAANLSTFINYNEDSYSTGNPLLTPSFTNSMEFGWTKFFNKFGNVGLSAYFRNSNNQSNQLTDVAYNEYFGRMVTYTMPINSGKSLNTGAELNMTYRLKAFMNIRFFANVYYSKSEFMFRTDQYRTVSNLGYSFRLNFWAKIWNTLEVHASANYRSKNVTLFNVTQPRYSIDCGLRTDLMKRKLSVYVNVNDIFNWNKSTRQSNNPYYQSSSTTKNVSRFISAGLTFRFGKMELESKGTQQGETEPSDID